MNAPKNTPASRRRFLKSAASGVVAGGALATFSIPAAAAGAAREFKVGLIGCGGRGTGAANNAREAAKLNGDTVTIHAVADAFNDRAERARRTNKVPKERTFVGVDAYHKLLALDFDYVILATPPYFRPQMIEAAVKAGKNIFTEKPVGVDAPGIRRVLAAGESAKTKGLSIAAGTQRRHQTQYIECQKRVADGAIGQVVTARCYWNQGGLWSREKDPNWTDMEWQIRNWLYFTWLSGDHIVEQHVHNLDVTNWFMGSHPIAVRGMGGRQVRTGKDKYGNIFDHFATELIYKNPMGSGYPDIRAISMCRQIVSCWNDVSEFVVGTKGSTNCRSEIFGPNAWKWRGKQVNPYVQEHIDLQASIKEGKGALNEAENVAHSTFTAILARSSNYTGKQLQWDKELKEGATWGPQEFDLNTPIEIPPVPQVGKPM